MTSNGLPMRLQQFLTGLAEDVGLSSWKISSQGDNTTVVLRFSAGSPCFDYTPADVGYRRKPPSQLRRDKERIEQYRTRKQQQQQQQQQSKASDSEKSPVLFQPTPDKLYFESPVDLDTALTPQQQHAEACVSQASMKPARATHATTVFNSEGYTPVNTHVNELDAMECGHSVNIGQRSSNDENQSDNNSDFGACGGGARSMPTEDQLADEAEQAGFSLTHIQDAVGEVFDKRRQRSLRDPDRNLKLTKVVLDKRGNNREELICESDDYVLQFDCQQQQLVNWYIKDGKRYRERGYVIDQEDCLMRWPNVPADHYLKEQRQAHRSLQILAAVVRVYLG